MSTATSALQGVTSILTRFFLSSATANVRLCGAAVLGAAVLRVPAAFGVNFTRLQPGDLFRVSHTFK